MKSVETQTHYQALVSSSTQTDSLESYLYELELHSNELNKESSSDEEYEPNKEENDKEIVSDDGGFELIHHPADSIILSSNKPPQDQITFIILISKNQLLKDSGFVRPVNLLVLCQYNITLELTAK